MWKARILSLLCGLLLFIPLGASADGGGGNGDSGGSKQVDPARVIADYESGYRQMKAGEYKTAIKAFKRVLDANPEHTMALNNMAYSYRKLGDYKRAISLYQKALAIDPNLPEAHEYIGEAFVALGKIDDAKRHLAILEQLDPRLANELRAEIARQNRS
jgi:tetratricopeptide (TPR) repeat protein